MIPLRDDNPISITPVVTVALIVLNVLVFLYQISLGERGQEVFVYQFGSIPAVLFGNRSLPADLVAIPSTLTVLTSMFLHGGFMHLAGNMLYLWIFGNNIEDATRHGRFVVFYIVCGVAAFLAHAFTNPSSTIPTVGASGAISGVLGAYLLLYPRAQVLVLVPLGFFSRMMYIPAGFVLALWFVLQILSGSMARSEGGGIAFWAHVGGFLAGMALIGIFKQRSVRFFNPAHHHPDRIERY